METLHEQFIEKAIQIAREGMIDGKGGPFGCVIVKDNIIIGSGCNSVASSNDPTAHAEIVAIRDACRNLKDFQLPGCDVYTSCEPCPMCLGAIYWARAGRVFFAATRYDAAKAGFDDSFIYEQLALPDHHKAIPLIHIWQENAVTVFHEWLANPGNIKY